MKRLRTFHITRRAIQGGFLALTLVGVYIWRGNAEAWCPFGGVEAFYQYATEGNLLCSLGVSNLYMLGAVLLMALLLRRAFCGYVCPLGAIFEWTGRAGERLGIRRWRTPQRLDAALRLLKYAVLGLILYFTWRAGELVFRGYDPCYALISRHGEDITLWAYVIGGGVLLLSALIMLPFCRWLCPLAAVLNPLSRFGLTRIERDAGGACTDCGVCGRRCPMNVPVERTQKITHARCISCFECTEHCPHPGALRWTAPRWLGGRVPRAFAAVGVLGIISLAVGAAYAFPLPSYVSERGERPAETASVDLHMAGLTCRGRATLLKYFLERDDLLAVRGYLRIEAWPDPNQAPVRLIFDPKRTTPLALQQAITEPYFDGVGGFWRQSPFLIEGYDPLGL